MNIQSQNQLFSSYQNRDFAKFLFEIFSFLKGIESQQLEIGINQSLKYLAEFINFDWATLCEFPSDELPVDNFYWYSAPCVPPPNMKTFYSDTQLPSELVRSGQTLYLKEVSKELPKDAENDRLFCMQNGLKTCVVVPFKINESVQGGLYLASIQMEHSFSDDILSGIQFFSETVASALERKRTFDQYQKALKKIDGLKQQISNPLICVRTKSKENFNNKVIAGISHSFKKMQKMAMQVAPTDAPVLLLGETGTGKGILAGTIHNASDRRNKQFIQVNCAGFSPSLIESELFGHEKGSFTGAYSRRIGCFERANQSTLFLDEISEIPIELQGKLLRILQEGEFERVGGIETMKANARVITATNKDLEMEVEAGRFRRDLWYRLNVYPIRLPNLSERIEDIPLFVDHFIEKYSKWVKKCFKQISQDTLDTLKNYTWPGNIRELENQVARAVINSADGILRFDLPNQKGTTSKLVSKQMTLEKIERLHILQTLQETMWRVEGLNGAAERLGLHPSTLRLRMKKHHLQRPHLSDI